MTRRPPALPRGGTIAVFSPSSAAVSRFPHRVARACQALETALECTVVVPSLARERRGYVALTAEEAATELHRLAASPSIDFVMMALGGFNTNRILPLLDWELLAAHPKIYCGYSDASLLLLAIYGRSTLVTLHGPSLLPQWGEIDGPSPEMVDSLRALVRGVPPPLELRPNRAVAFGQSDWDEAREAPRARRAASGWETWREGEAVGTLFGGNVGTINCLLGTPWMLRPDDAVFFWEATGAEAYLPRLERSITHLAQAGMFERITGMIVGRCPDAHPVDGVSLRDMVLSVTQAYDFPILGEVDLGHTDPILTLPIGARLRIVAGAGQQHLTILESAVS